MQLFFKFLEIFEIFNSILIFFGRYEYISVLDIDEVMMPKQHDNWEQMMKQAVQDSIQVCYYTQS